ncbi:prenyltransferase/squalene oxidase repeat-containing protein [Planctomycetota bacterium]
MPYEPCEHEPDTLPEHEYNSDSLCAIEFPTANDQRNRMLLVITSSYGLSGLIHAGLLLILLFVIWTERLEVEKKEASLLPKLERPKETYDPDIRRAMRKKPRIDSERIVRNPVVPLEDPEPTAEPPKGDPLRQSNKEMRDAGVSDPMGVGGRPAGAYGHRWNRGRHCGDIGMSDVSESAVLAALYWLKRHQDPDGKWSAAEFHRNCDASRKQCWGHDMRTALAKGPGAGDSRYDVGVSALALLAFLGDGHTHRHARIPEFRPVVKRGLSYLRSEQRPDGSVGFEGGEGIYNHAIATLALCECYAVSRDFTLRSPAQKAVDWLVRAQNPGLGWKYGVQTGKNDTSVTGWSVLALKAARVAKLTVPQAAFDGAVTWFERVTTDGTGPRRPPGLVGYERPGDGGSTLNRKCLDNPDSYNDFAGAPTMTAVSVLCRLFTGQDRSHPRVKQGLRIMTARPPRWDGPAIKRRNQTNFYYWYYGTYGVFQATKPGSPQWRRWNRAMQEALLGDGTNRQRMGRDDDADGSWDPVGEWGLPGGRVYATALNALTLEIYYRYERVVAENAAGSRKKK